MHARILIVEDDAAMARFVRLGLERKGFTVECRASSAAAPEAPSAGSFDALVTDLNMPAATGLDLVRTHSAAHTNIPAIVITAFGSLETAIEAIRAGAYDFLTKPFEKTRAAEILGIDRKTRVREIAIRRTTRVGLRQNRGTGPKDAVVLRLWESGVG